MIDQLVQYDKELFLFLNNLGTESWDSFWMFMTNKLSSIPLYLFLLIICVKKLGVKPTLLIIIIVALMIAATDQLANAFKYGFERLRPCHDESIFNKMRLVKPYCGGKFGYFSAHAANSFAMATLFSLLFKKYFNWIPFLLLFWALLVAYSRIYIGVHFPLDVITGICIGLLFGWMFFALYRILKGRITYFNT